MSDDHKTNSRRGFLTKALIGSGALATRSVPAVARKKKKKDRKKPEPALFRDGFKRHDGRGWGDPWLNQRYGRNWTIKDHRGLLRLPASESSVNYKPVPIVVLDHDVRYLDLRATLSVSNKTMRAGLLGRMTGYSDHYAAHIGPGNEVRIVRCGLQDEKVLKKRDLRVDENRRYRFRLQVRGIDPVDHQTEGVAGRPS